MTTAQTKSKKVPMGQMLMTARVNDWSPIRRNDAVEGIIGRKPKLDVSGGWARATMSQHTRFAVHSLGRPPDLHFEDSKIVRSSGEKRIWIITEADRRSTTVLFPSDY